MSALESNRAPKRLKAPLKNSSPVSSKTLWLHFWLHPPKKKRPPKSDGRNYHHLLMLMAEPTGLEPATFDVTGLSSTPIKSTS